MNIMLTLASLLTMLMMISSINPMKMSFAVMISSSLMLTNMALSLGTIWMPVIFLMLFMGGIIMMFMILSSILPNEKSMKIKSSSWKMMASSFLILMIWSLMSKDDIMLSQMKSFLNSSTNMAMMIILILSYFFTSMKILSEESSPLRSSMCHLLNQFCKLKNKYGNKNKTKS